MRRPYPGKLRLQVVDFVEGGGTRREAAEQFEVSASSAIRWMQRICEDGVCESMRRGGSISPLERYSRQISAMKRDDKASIESLLSLRQEAVDMKEAILKGDIHKIGDALHRGWLAKQKTAAGISTDHIATLIDGGLAAGAYAGKVSGAGGGGFVFLLVDPPRRHAVVRALSDRGGVVLPCNFTSCGVESWRW